MQAWLMVKNRALSIAADAHLVAHGGEIESLRAQQRFHYGNDDLDELVGRAVDASAKVEQSNG